MQKKPMEKGFTLVETIITTALFAIGLAIVSGAAQSFYQSNRYTIEQSAAIASARRGVTKTVQDIREAQGGDNGSYALESLSTTSLSMYVDTDEDDFIEFVEIYATGTDFLRDITEFDTVSETYTGATSTEIIADNVQNLVDDVSIFTYFDEDGNEVDVATEAPATSDVRYVKVRLIVNVNPAKAPNEFVLTSSAVIRNLIGNLNE